MQGVGCAQGAPVARDRGRRELRRKGRRAQGTSDALAAGRAEASVCNRGREPEKGKGPTMGAGGVERYAVELTKPQLFGRRRLVWQIVGQIALRRAAQ